MNTEDCHSLQIRGWLLALDHQDESARRHLLDYARLRFEVLARKMLRGEFGRVARWTETGDVLQGAMLRLWQALQEYVPADELAFRRLVALELRRELIDLARKHFGPQGLGKNHDSAAREPNGSTAAPAAAVAHESADPRILSEWTEFHEHADQLPEKLRDVFDLRYYHGLLVEEAADNLGVSKATVKLRWAEALSRLRTALNGKELPGG